MAEHLPSHLQQRADAEVGALLRRCEAALPEGWTVHLGGSRGRYRAAASSGLEQRPEFIQERASDPAAALAVLAEALESR